MGGEPDVPWTTVPSEAREVLSSETPRFLLASRRHPCKSMRERTSMNSISLRILLVVAAAALGYAVPAQAENYFCQQQFALCTSAPCIPEPGNPKVAICTCDVVDAPNLATVACDTVKPSTDAN